MPNLSVNGLLGMVFEHFQYFFHLQDFANGFSHLFQLCFHLAQGHIPHRIAHILGVATHLLIMTKPLGGIRPIIIGEMLYRLTIHALCLQFRNAFATHFFPHQFGIATKGGCETIIHGIRCTLDLHPNWVVFQLNMTNAFNLVSKGVIFQ
jgi:hypothetical protein